MRGPGPPFDPFADVDNAAHHGFGWVLVEFLKWRYQKQLDRELTHTTRNQPSATPANRQWPWTYTDQYVPQMGRAQSRGWGLVRLFATTDPLPGFVREGHV